MDVTKELEGMLAAEDAYIEGIVRELYECGETLSVESYRHLRMGFRTKQLVDLAISRAKAKRVTPVEVETQV
jgi:hypothetical protein